MKNERRIALLLALTFAAASCSGPVDRVDSGCARDLAGLWKFRAGDDAEWARPDLDDSRWDEVTVPAGRGLLGRHADVAWYRREVRLDSGCLEGGPAPRSLGLTLGKVDSAYEVFAGGALLGGVGALPPAPRIGGDRHRTYPLPDGAASPDGRVLVALRVWKSPETRGRVGHPYAGPYLLGPLDELVRRELLSELPWLFLSGVLLLLGVTRLALFQSRRRVAVYAWFGLSSLCAAGATLLRTQWKYALSDRVVPLKEAEHLFLYLLVAVSVQLLWSLLGLRIGIGLRVLQGLYLAAGILVAATPGLTLNSLLLPFCHGGAVLATAIGLGAIGLEAWRGNPEARTVAVGAALCAGVFVYDIAVDRGLFVGPRVAAVGLALLAASLAVSLANRFASAREEPVALRAGVEREVEQRTHELRKASAAKSRFLATLSHEIRTPLTGVIGAAELLLEGPLDDGQREYAEMIRDSGDALIAQLSDVLDFSQIESGRMELHPIDFDLRATVGTVVATFSATAERRSLALASSIGEDVPKRLRGDPGRLRQVLGNLLSNALKYTAAGEVRLQVRRAAQEEEEDRRVVLRFEVEDTGIGVTEEEKGRLFRSYSRLDGPGSQRREGSGLGLAISKQLAELMGGEIGVESKAGEGSCFWFSARFEPLPAREERPPAARHLGGRSVLVVESDLASSQVLEGQLASMRIAGRMLSGSAAALETLRRAADEGAPFDAALLGTGAGADAPGLELVQAIRADPTLESVPVVLLAGAGRRGDAEKARQAGAEAYLTKPVRRDELRSCLEQVLALRSDGPPAALVTRHSVAEARATHTARPLHVLVVEDDAVSQALAARMLDRLGHRADLVREGREALTALEHGRYDVAFLDVHLPGLDGLSVARRFRLRHPPGSPPWLVGITAATVQGDREACLAAGMDDYLAKPLRLNQLKNALARVRLGFVTEPVPGGEPKAGEGAGDGREPLLDQNVLRRLQLLDRPGEPETVSLMAGLFLRDAPGRMKAAATALAGGDFATVERLAHGLKGSAGTLGARRLVACCVALEAATKFGAAETEEHLRHAEEQLRLLLPELARERDAGSTTA